MSLARCVAFLCILVAVFTALSPHFLSWSNAQNILSASAVIGLLALGSTFVIASGAIDLSVASVMALSGTVCAALVTSSTSTPPLFAVAVCIGTGTLCGLVTGTLINITGAPSFVVTLGMLSVARALSYIIADGMPIYGLPDAVTAWGQGELLGLPGSITLLLVGAAIGFFVLRFTRFGTHTLVYGDNPFAAAAMGIRVQWLRRMIFTVCGAYSGLAGFVFMARTNAGDPTAGQNYELVAITAVILGGAKLFGGEASALGTLLGVLCLSTLQNGLNLLAVSSYYQVLFIGLVLISAAFLERIGEKG
jgi:ribose transport system permease protein